MIQERDSKGDDTREGESALECTGRENSLVSFLRFSPPTRRHPLTRNTRIHPGPIQETSIIFYKEPKFTNLFFSLFSIAGPFPFYCHAARAFFYFLSSRYIHFTPIHFYSYSFTSILISISIHSLLFLFLLLYSYSINCSIISS